MTFFRASIPVPLCCQPPLSPLRLYPSPRTCTGTMINAALSLSLVLSCQDLTVSVSSLRESLRFLELARGFIIIGVK